MVKKIVVSGLALTLVGFVVFGRDATSYFRAGVTSVRDTVRGGVPLEFEIQRARQEIGQLLPAIRQSVTLIAQEQVDVDRLVKSIAKREASLAEQEEAILSLSGDLKSGDLQFVYAGRKYSLKDVERDLAERFNRFQIAEDTLHRERALLQTKQTALEAHRQTLEGMLSQRKGLEVELERLEARHRTVQARQQLSNLAIDDSQLAKVQNLIATIEKRLDVEDAVLAAEGDLHGLIPVERSGVAESPEEIVDRVEAYFSVRGSLNTARLAKTSHE